ncbi:hypothetical protein AAFF39_08900 [Lactococcus garvieae]
MEAQLSTSQQNTAQEVQVGKAVPVILLLMIFSLVIDNSFKIISLNWLNISMFLRVQSLGK